MPTIVMPQPGQSVTEGTILKWLKQVGDPVGVDEILVEVETEKVNVEVPSPFAGTLTQILAQEGETVPVGAELAVVGDVGASPADTPAPNDSKVRRESAAVEAAESTDGDQPNDGTEADSRAVTVSGPAAQPVAAPSPPQRNGAASPARYSPAVLRLAAEHDLDLSAIHGTGMGGRITRKDVVQFLERRAHAAPVDIAAARASDVPSQPTHPTAPVSAAVAVAPPAAAAPAGEDQEILRPSPTRLSIARNMVRSAQTAPAAWMVVEVDVTGLVALRESHKAAFRQREGVDLSYLPFIAQVVVAALKEHRMLNSEWRDEQIVVKRRINLGIAVGVEDGLIVPVIHDADRLSLAGLAHALADLSARARARTLRIDDVTGGTFTLDNTGVFGSLVSQPIINPPQAAILSTEAIIKRPVVRDDAIAIRSMMNACLAFDHRVTDGAEALRFLQSVKRRVEAYGPGTAIY